MSRIGLVYDLRSEYLAAGYGEEAVAEFDSDATIEALAATIQRLGHSVERIGNVRSLCAALVRGERWDLVFTIAEGLNGRCREAQVPALLEAYGIPYTFSDPLVCALTLDKAMAKVLLKAAGLPTPEFFVVRQPSDLRERVWDFPVFVKPNAEGTGKGIDDGSLVHSEAELAERCREHLPRFTAGLLVEEFLPGREFTVGILGTGLKAFPIGTMEICLKPAANTTIYSYEVKEKCESLVSYKRLGKGRLKQSIEALAVAAYRVLECRDTGRVDIRLDRTGKPSFLEINPLPGLHPSHSDLPMIATREGMPYEALIRQILDSAFERVTARAASAV